MYPKHPEAAYIPTRKDLVNKVLNGDEELIDRIKDLPWVKKVWEQTETKPTSDHEELVKEIQWLLRILRQDITLEETAPLGLQKQQEFLQNHFKKEFEELYKNNPQQLAQIKASPWFKFHPFLKNLPELEPSEPKQDEPANVPTDFELNEEFRAQIWAKLNEGDKEHEEEIKTIRAQNQTAVALQAKEKYQPPKICEHLECQSPVFGENKKCAYHQWEIEADERLNAQITGISPNLPQTPQEPAEDTTQYHTTIEDESEAAEVIIDETENENNDQEVNNNDSDNNESEESNQEPTPELNRGDNSNENNHQEPNHNDNNENGEENNQPGKSEKNWKIPTAAIGVGAAVVAGITGIGYYTTKNAAFAGAVKSATGFWHLIKAGTTAQQITNQALAGASWSSYFAAGITKIGAALKWLVGLLSSPWVWIPLLIIGACVIYKKWNTIKRWFGYGTQTVARTAERINDTILENEFIRSRVVGEETEAERQARNLNTEISQINTNLENFRTEMRESEERRSEVDTTIFENQHQQLETQIAQAETRLAELETRYNNLPEQVRQSSQAKQEQWLAFRQKADRKNGRRIESPRIRTKSGKCSSKFSLTNY